MNIIARHFKLQSQLRRTCYRGLVLFLVMGSFQGRIFIFGP